MEACVIYFGREGFHVTSLLHYWIMACQSCSNAAKRGSANDFETAFASCYIVNAAVYGGRNFVSYLEE